MADNGEIKFHTDSLFTGDTGTIDSTNSTIRGVSVITGGQEAEGHGLTIDDETLRQLQACAKERGKIPVTLDHGSGVKDLNGFLTGFRIDSSGDKPKIRADWHLLETHPETKVMIEKAEKMPTCFGLSVAFKGPPKGVPIGGGKMAARCEKLLSVDVVTRPAANEGLFSVPEVDKSGKSMAKKEVKLAEGDPEPEPTLQDVIAAVQQLNGRLDQHEEFLGQLQGAQGAQDEDPVPTLEQLAAASDEELAQLGLTRAEVDAAVQEVLAGMEAENAAAGRGEGTPAGTPQGEGELVGAGAPAAGGFSGGEAPATFKALQKQVVQLENKLKLTELRKKQEAEEIELSEIEQKVLILANQRDEAIKLAETQQAEIEALRLAVRTGTRPVTAGVDNGLRMFGVGDNGQLHEFQVRVKQLVESGKTQGEAITFAQKENPALHADWVQSQGRKKVA